MSGLLLPRERSKTLTALVGAEPLVQAQAAEVQRLQFFLSEATWDAEAVNAQRLRLLKEEPATAPSDAGVLVIDDTGDRKDGRATDHVARQYLGSVGKVDNGIVADCFYGDNHALEAALLARRLPHVLARRGALGRGWAPVEADHSFKDAAKALALRAWREVTRRFRDGHTERWWAAELTLLEYGPGRPMRAICATTDRRALPALSTWYLTTNLPAPLAEIVRLYGLRNWIEQGYKQMKDELGWADFMVRSDRAIRRHWTLVCCAFAFCWWNEAMQTRASQSLARPEAGEKNQRRKTTAVLASPVARGARLVDPGLLAGALLECLCQHAPARRTRRAAGRLEHRPRHQPLPPALTNYR